MKLTRDLFFCLPNKRFETLHDAREAMQIARWHNVTGSVAKSCTCCGGFHVHYGPRMTRDQRRLLWFVACMVTLILATVGASVFQDTFWFCVYLLIGFAVVTVGTLWEYRKL